MSLVPTIFDIMLSLIIGGLGLIALSFIIGTIIVIIGTAIKEVRKPKTERRGN